MGGCIRQVAASGGCLLRFHCTVMSSGFHTGGGGGGPGIPPPKDFPPDSAA